MITIITAFLSRIPLKDYLYASLIVALCVGFGLFVHHERSVGAAARDAVVAKASADQLATTEKVVGSANDQIRAAETIAATKLVLSIPDSPHVFVCDPPPADGTGPVSTTGASGGAVHEPAESTVEHPRDVGPELDEIGRDADVEIEYLQKYVQACQAAGYCGR